MAEIICMTYARLGQAKMRDYVDYGEDDYFQSDKIYYFCFFFCKNKQH